MVHDVVIVGGGLSGLAAALRIHDAAPETDFVVLEARDRLGGRTLTEEHSGVAFDLGGTWVGPLQEHVLALLERFGLERVPQFCAGRKVLDFGNKVSSYASDIPSMSWLSLIDVQLALWRIGWFVGSVPKDDPYKAPRAQELDSMTAATFFDKHLWTASGRALSNSIVQAIFGVEPCDVSALHFLWYISSSTSVDNLITVTGGNQQWTVRGGLQQLSDMIAARFPDRVRVGARVATIDQDAQPGVAQLQLAGGEVVRGRRVIVAVPPAIARGIEFVPALPAKKRELLARNFMGGIVKIFVVYEAAHWVAQGFSGEVLTDGAGKGWPVFNAFDASKDRPDGSRVHALVLFINGEAARESAGESAGARREAVLQQLVRWFGPKMAHPIDYFEKDWVGDGGCPVAVNGPGVLTSAGPVLRAPCGLIHWASTELGRVSQGFMDGAIESGYRAAGEVVAKARL